MSNPNEYPQQNQPQQNPQTPQQPPQYGAPQYGAPQYGAPQYGTPQYGVPQYSPAPGQYQAPGNGIPPLNKPFYRIGFPAAIGRFFQKYAVFTGRASKGEFWWVILFLFLVNIVLGLVVLPLPATFSTWIARAWSLATLIPFLAVGVRRIHDTNKPTAWILLPALPMLIGEAISWFSDMQATELENLATMSSTQTTQYITTGAGVGVLELIGVISGLVLMLGATNPAGARFDDDQPV